MSSMRNAVQRRNHKERAQPEERKKWGLLEKRKVCLLSQHKFLRS
jgi:U3 small nucleolar RNA-associated protein 11